MTHVTKRTHTLRCAVILLAGAALAASPASAKTYYLVAKELTKTVPAQADPTLIDFSSGSIDPYGGLQDFPGGTVVLDEVGTTTFYGGITAAPIFKEIAEGIIELRHLTPATGKRARRR